MVIDPKQFDEDFINNFMLFMRSADKVVTQGSLLMVYYTRHDGEKRRIDIAYPHKEKEVSDYPEVVIYSD